jgi:Bifunctional DNA primase/polymerase, N-terminal/Primase C terminal 1 (PriCT-1)
MTATLISAALGLAERGFRVFPCMPRGKEPAVVKGSLAATTDQNVIKGWWRGNSACNIGLATGAGSGVFVVDVDGANAEAMLRELQERHGALPATVEAITARGRHLYFRWLDGVEVRNSAGRIAAGIDVRGEGGYVLAPPSVHPSGRRYCWSVDSADSFAAAPKWLLEALVPRGPATVTATPATSWRDIVRDEVTEGRRNDTLARFAGHLLRRWVDPLVTLEFLLTWNAMRCRPPLDESEVFTIVNSIAGRELKRRGSR